jgi:hypothetical protein
VSRCLLAATPGLDPSDEKMLMSIVQRYASFSVLKKTDVGFTGLFVWFVNCYLITEDTCAILAV